jgi:SAM-dependent methyltransferase
MAGNELSVAAFYCSRFGDHQATETSKKDDNNLEASKTNNLEASNKRDFWEEDVWTEEDETKAHQLLQDHLDKCSVSSLDRHDTHKHNNDGEAWNQFYRDHGTRFFKDRHYFEKAFPEEFSAAPDDDKKRKALVEIGCGVGNALLPLLEDDKSPWKVIHGMDISREAILLLQSDHRFIECNDKKDKDRSVYGHVCDISTSLPTSCVGVADVTTLLFCLSAIDPLAMPQAAQHVASSLRPGGVLVFRDYGRYDEAQMKLGMSRNKLLKDNFYRKHDGTKCFYFTLEVLKDLFCGVGLEVLELKYLRRVYRNNALREQRRRVWVQGRFQKPHENP